MCIMENRGGEQIYINEMCNNDTNFFTFQPERVLQALKRYMAAEQKDRRHTLRHYQHIVAVDPQKAEQMKFQVCF